MLESICHMCSSYFVITFVVKTSRFCHVHDVVVTLTKYFLLYYTIIDFNEVDIRIYLPKKVIIHRGH